MPQTHFSPSDVFDAFPDPVFLLDELHILYRNPAARHYFHELGDRLPPLLADTLAHMGYAGQLALPQGDFLISSSQSEGGRFLFLRPSGSGKDFDLPAVSGFTAQLRRCLSALLLTLEPQQGEPQKDSLLAAQSHALHHLLRLTRQLELSQGETLRGFPLEMLNLNTLCERLIRALHEELDGVSPVLETENRPLFVMGNRALLEQLLLSLLSNAMKSCGLEGSFGIRLHERNRRAMLSVWDQGPGIPRERMPELFSPKPFHAIPEPGDGSGLDLFIAHQIALLHDGVLMAGNRPERGAEFTLSLPLAAARHMRLRSTEQLLPNEDLSPLLIALSDVLPARYYGKVFRRAQSPE